MTSDLLFYILLHLVVVVAVVIDLAVSIGLAHGPRARREREEHHDTYQDALGVSVDRKQGGIDDRNDE